MTPDITTKTISPVSSPSVVEEAESAAATPALTTSLMLPSTASLPIPQQMTLQAPALALASSPSSLPSSAAAQQRCVTTTSSSITRRHLLTIEKLRNRVHQILKCVINLHIDILVIESNVNQLLDDVKEFNADLMEVERLDTLIQTLRDYNGPTICHEWPFPLVFEGTIDEADLAQTLNTNDLISTA